MKNDSSFHWNWENSQPYQKLNRKIKRKIQFNWITIEMWITKALEIEKHVDWYFFPFRFLINLNMKCQWFRLRYATFMNLPDLHICMYNVRIFKPVVHPFNIFNIYPQCSERQRKIRRSVSCPMNKWMKWKYIQFNVDINRINVQSGDWQRQ